MGPIPELVVEGSPGELGKQHGELARTLVHDVYRRRMGHCSRHVSEATVLQRAMAYVPYAVRYAPELVDEVSGLAEGAGLTFERAFFLQVATELENQNSQGCSSLGSGKCASGPFLAQNWDQPADTRGQQIILHVRPGAKPEVVMFTHAGVIGYIGVNAAGVGHVNNQLYASERPMGLTGYFITRKLLGFGSVSEGLAWLEGVEIGSSANYMLGDASGDIVDIELGDGGFRRIEHSSQSHTNHYLTEGWRSADRVAEVLPDSLDRQARLAKVFCGDADESVALEALKDHHGFPLSICRHEGEGGLSTAASILIRLRKPELLVCYGNPCTGTYVGYPVRRDSQMTRSKGEAI